MSNFELRQVHLDFHTSPLIPDIGVGFNKKEWQDTLKKGHVNSITVFSKCHHGYSFHPTKANEMHPHLKFDLLKSQLDACEEIGVRAPVYISAGFDEKEARRHPDWIVRSKEQMGTLHTFENPGFNLICFNTPYLDMLLSQVEEVMEIYNPCEIFLDIVGERVCYCPYCLDGMKKQGLDFNNDNDVLAYSKAVYRNYLDKIQQTVKKHNPKTIIFQNSGHLSMGRRDLVDTIEILELESLPTGGWGYDHFPMSASYARTLNENYLGMTGKFHGTWGEFGGFKHPNALIYETALSLSQGAGCSIGDQMHPDGKLNTSTFDLIGKAYSEVEKKEPWCIDASNIADIGVLSVESRGFSRQSEECKADVGANRILLETKRLYNFIDIDEDFSKYKLIIMPDHIVFDNVLKEKVNNYLKNGGKILLSGVSGLDESKKFCVDTGITYINKNQFNPTYLVPEFATVNGFTEYLMRCDSHLFKNNSATIVSYGQNPYFNRTAQHFCSHQHAPNNREESYPTSVINGNIAYIGWDIFTGYGTSGDFHLKELIAHFIELLIKDDVSLKVQNMPDRGIATLTQLKNKKVVHLLFAHTTKRGQDTEVIQDIVPLFDVKLSVKCTKPKSVTLVPENQAIDFTYANGEIAFTVPKVYIHQMISIE